MYSIKRGKPELGCKQYNGTLHWGIYGVEAIGMLLRVYDTIPIDKPIFEMVLNRDTYATGDIFHIAIEGLLNPKVYTWQVIHSNGFLSDCIIDPYSRCILQCPKTKQYLNSIVEEVEPQTKRPYIPWDETIIYELHVGSFTRSYTSGIKENKRGTFLGLIDKLEYLKDLGITSIELLPIFKWNKYTVQNKHPYTGERMKDEWGYNTIAFFALQDEYSIVKEEVNKEFLAFVDAAHRYNMEVILDVVYNHTGEGGLGGATFNFKCLGDTIYYKKANHSYLNCAGTGNVLNTAHLVVKNMILDSLRYWVTTFGIDGFRFDLASILQQDAKGNWVENGLLTDIAQDPILKSVKLITESWDAKGSYDVGKMPKPFREWSDFYRDTIRKVVRGDEGITKDLARCIVGQDILYTVEEKNSQHSIHFITSHDGFTMWDLVSYNQKHNELNGEENRDGHNSNYSDNCGVEGETVKEEILALRMKRIKNYFTILLLSRGIPMILMGDELGRTQYGNNNAFCQNSEMFWVNWSGREGFDGVREFLKRLIVYRKKMKWFKAKSEKKIYWHGVIQEKPDWSCYSRSLAWEIVEEDERFYMAFNNYVEVLNFELPKTEKKWIKIIDTDKRQSFLEYTYYGDEKEFVAPFSLCVFKEV